MEHREVVRAATRVVFTPEDAVQAAVAELPEVEQAVLVFRYGIGCADVTVAEIARSLDVTVLDVWEIESRALETIGFTLLTAHIRPFQPSVAVAQEAIRE